MVVLAARKRGGDLGTGSGDRTSDSEGTPDAQEVAGFARVLASRRTRARSRGAHRHGRQRPSVRSVSAARRRAGTRRTPRGRPSPAYRAHEDAACGLSGSRRRARAVFPGRNRTSSTGAAWHRQWTATRGCHVPFLCASTLSRRADELFDALPQQRHPRARARAARHVRRSQCTSLAGRTAQ